MDYYASHTNLTRELWTEYTANALKTEPPCLQLLANLNLLTCDDPAELSSHLDAYKKEGIHCFSGDAEEVTTASMCISLPRLTDLDLPRIDLDTTRMHAAGQIVHGTIGLATEIVEARNCDLFADMLKELGDICWYSAIALEGLRAAYLHNPVFDLIEGGVYTNTSSLPQLLREFELAVGVLKKVTMYGRRDLASSAALLLLTGLNSIDRFVLNNASMQCLNMADLLRINSRKLLKGRYASGSFSNKQAQERADVVGKDDDKM